MLSLDTFITKLLLAGLDEGMKLLGEMQPGFRSALWKGHSGLDRVDRLAGEGGRATVDALPVWLSG